MKKTFERFPLGMLIASVIAALAFTAFRIFLTLTVLVPRYGVYDSDSILPTIYHSALAVAVVVFAILAIVKSPKREPDYTHKVTDFTVFATCACGFLLAFEVVFTIYKILTTNTEPSTFDIVEICFAVPAIIYFIGIITSHGKKSAALMLTSLFPTAWCAVCLIRIYFDVSVLQTSPNKILGEIALLATMFYFLSEARVQLGKHSSRLHIAAASIAPILLLSSAVPNLLFSRLLSIGLSDDFMRYAIDAVFALFMWARLGAYARASNEDAPAAAEDTKTEEI